MDSSYQIVTTLYPLEGDELLSHFTGIAYFRRNLLQEQ
jgi:hypothetical protein